jgi:hypothetical protein
MVKALSNALLNVPNAPAKFDVIGFDACNMQAIGTVDDYRKVSKYFLASETLEPGHGWAYNELWNVNSALDFALNIHSSFLQSMHGYQQHKTPKILSIVDTAKYNIFLSAWNGFFSTLQSILTGQGDPELFTLLNRARTNSIAFETVLDEFGASQPSAVDIGSFLTLFEGQCDPIPGSQVHRMLGVVRYSYQDMFVVSGYGEGTVPATGMHVVWPLLEEYRLLQKYYDQVLLDPYNIHATGDAREWLEFLRTYYEYDNTIAFARDAGQTSVCRLGTGSGIDSALSNGGKLLLNPSVSGLTAGGHEISTRVARETHSIQIEYGINLTPLLQVNDRQRKLRERASDHVQRGESPQRRHLGSNNDYLIQFGGSISGDYIDGNRYSAFFDRQFYLLEDPLTGQTEDVYTMDLKNGSKQVPVLYIPPRFDAVTYEDVYQLRFESLSDTVLQLQAEWAYLSFSSSSSSSSIGKHTYPVSLYSSKSREENGFSSDAVASGFREIPPSAGGQIIPFVYVEGMINNESIDVLIGGYGSSLFHWNEAFPVRIVQKPADLYLIDGEASEMYIDIVAAGGDSSTENQIGDFEYFIIRPDYSVQRGGTYGSSSAAGTSSKAPWILLLASSAFIACSIM